MGCGIVSPAKSLGAFSITELQLLELMYADLTKRSKMGRLQKDTFLTFFHLNGLWGEQIYGQFDTKKLGSLDFCEFKRGIETLVKGSYESKVHFLFVFYDIEKKNGISYECLLKMLYSYPKEQLKLIIQDEYFMGNMNDQERLYHFGIRKELDPLREVVDEESSTDYQANVKQRKMSQAVVFNEYSVGASENQKVQGVIDMRPWATKLPKVRVSNNKSSSMSFANIKQACKAKMCSNITLLVKKYANYLFKQFNLHKDRDFLRQDQFLALIRKHQRIFMFYYESFHNYIWEVQEQTTPQFIRNTSWVEGNACVTDSRTGNKNNRFLRFYKTTIFVFRYVSDNIPVDIINMEGLYVEESNIAQEHGFIIKHRDGLYPQNQYSFKSKSVQEEWIRNLGVFMRNSVYDSYTFLEKIGAGNYSVVYKGLQKQTQMPVAIKVIEKFKFTVTEKQVLKQQCSILELCHHPNIVTLMDRFQSKTTLFIVTEFFSSGDLYEYVKNKRFLEELEAATVISDILQAVSYLNQLGLIHRDLKSENIMIRLDKLTGQIERAKIIDFGFAVYADNIKSLPEKERFAGTPNFVAPQILLGQDFDEKIDMFSLGVIMYFLLTGELPFDSIFIEDITKQTIDCAPSYNESHWRNISQQARDLIRKLLVKKEQRITVYQALRHPWIRNRKNLKEYIGKNKKRKYM